MGELILGFLLWYVPTAVLALAHVALHMHQMKAQDAKRGRS